MNDDTNSLHPWIEPELEARLTALVLGEASDFERDELERLIAERPELALYRKRLEVMHRMLREVSKGESEEDQGEWKLGAERRDALLARLRGEVEAEAKVVVMSGPKVRLPWGLIGRIAACFAVIGLVLSLILRSMTTVLGDAERSKNNAMAFAYSDGRETLSRSDRHGGVSVSGSNGVPLDDSDLRRYPPAQKEWQHYPAAAEEKSAGERESEQFALSEPANSNFGTTTSSPAPAPAKVGDREMAVGLEGANTFTGGVTISGGGLVVSDPAPSTRTEVETRGTIGGRDNTTAVKSESLGTAAVPAPTTSTLAMVDADDDGVDRLSRSKEMSELAESEVVQVQEGKDQRGLRRESLVAAAPGAGIVEGKKPSMYEFGTTDITFRDIPATEVDADLLPPQPSVPIASPKPASTPMAAARAEVDLATSSGGVMTKVGAGNVTLNGGGVIAESPKPESQAGQNAYTGDTQVVAGTVSGSGSVALRGGTSRTGDFRFNQSGATTPAESELAKRKRDGAAEDEKGGEVSEGEALALGLDLADADRTKDHVIRRELPSELGAFDTTKPSGKVNFGAGVSTIGNLSGFFEVTETSSSMDPETAARLKKMRYFDGDEAESNHHATAESGFELPGLQSDKKTFRFSVRAGSHRTDAEVTIDEPWMFRHAGEVDQSVADIMALTPQVGKDEHLFTRHFNGGSTGLRGFDYRDVAAKESGDETAVRLDYGAPLDESKSTSEGRFQFTMGASFGDESVPAKAEAKKPTPAALAETSPAAEPFSTFSLHVSDVSFQLAEASLASGKWPEAEKIRIEEFVNAFDYGDPIPAMDERVACRIDQAAHPFLQQRNLVRIALRTAEAGRSSGTPLRLTLLLDSSGSMERPDRRETLTRAVTTLAGLLGENDRITLVSFARQPRLVADAVPGNEAMKLAETVAALPSEGGTNLEAALQLAFEKAREHQEPNAQNRIVLLTDGAANLGDAKAESLGQRVEMMRDSGIAFDAAGFGAEGLNDEILEALTRKGDGRYYLLDRPEDAEDAFAKQIAGALRPAAKNVKVQVEFNPDRVKSYKLLGFEKHLLATEDFRNDTVDAAEMAAAEAGVAVYQVEPIPGGEGDLGSVSVRFRDLDSDEMIERRWGLAHMPAAPSAGQGGDAILLATVASQFAAKLAGGPLGDVVDLGELARLAAELPESERVKELRTMIEQARNLEGVSVSF